MKMVFEEVKKRIAKHEGVRLKPYKDTVGKLTIGITRAEAVDIMAGEMFRAACAICGDPKKNWRDCDLLPTTINFYLGMAEAALDALIRADKTGETPEASGPADLRE